MGPYCNFCGRRCFCHFPDKTSEHILVAYGTNTIIATCRGGQEFEKKKIGYCYDDILKEIEAVEHTLAGGLAVRPANCDCDSWVVLGRHDDWCPANR